ncbi:MAG: phospho-sugar mutase [Anaerovoracaceae bacterium]
MNYYEKYKLWRQQDNLPEDLSREINYMYGDEDLIKEAFLEDLAFGTSGLRGIMGAGTNRMNLPIIEKVTQGLANYLNGHKNRKPVLISFDTRNNSEKFARATAQVLAANQIKTYIFEEPTPVSILSYGVRKLKCAVAIMITASHNGREYNGYKVYNDFGGQIVTGQAKEILAEINKVEIFNGPKKADPETAQANIELVAKNVVADFIKENIDSSYGNVGVNKLKVVYTPLNGTGLKPVLENLRQIGVMNVKVVPEQEGPDGNFPYCPKPNPEKPEVYSLGQKLMEASGADFMIATDPDCDRIGMALQDRVLKGNQVGVLLFEYICSQIAKATKLGSKAKVGVRSIVSTPLFDQIAKTYGVKVEQTLIGFKYIGEKMETLKDRFIFGFEEGNGYLGFRHMRDKDGVSTAMLICQMAGYHKSQGRSIDQALEEIYQKYGYYNERVLNFTFEGIDGKERREKIMESFRHNIPETIFNTDVLNILDYREQKSYSKEGNSNEGVLPVSNILEYNLGEGRKIIVRPSGTEPLLKVYLFAKGDNMAKATKQIDALEESITRIINQVQ